MFFIMRLISQMLMKAWGDCYVLYFMFVVLVCALSKAKKMNDDIYSFIFIYIIATVKTIGYISGSFIFMVASIIIAELLFMLFELPQAKAWGFQTRF